MISVILFAWILSTLNAPVWTYVLLTIYAMARIIEGMAKVMDNKKHFE